MTKPRLDGAILRPVPEISAGQQCGRYVVLRELGSGGMSVVYAAYDPELDRQVALKLMRPSPGSKTLTADRLLREAQALARLAHPNVVHVYDVGTVDDQVYVAMELIEGKTLGSWVEDASPSWREIVETLHRAGEGLGAAHAAGLVHLDFKPGNVLLGDDGRVRVVDFGLARRPRSPDSLDFSGEHSPPSDSHEVPSSQTGSARLDAQLTEHGVVTGTPGYIAPEQLLGKTVDAHADQFAFCVTLYRCLYGTLPFPRDNTNFLRKVRLGEVEAKGSTPVPRFVLKALMRGMSLHAHERFASMEELLDALSIKRHDQRRWIGGGSVVAAGVAGVLFWPNESDFDCDQGQVEMQMAWTEELRSEIGQAFAATGIERAPDQWSRISPRIDDWTTKWGAEYQEACEATHVRKEQSAELLGQRMLCLRRHRVQFDAVTDQLRNADAGVIEHADDIVASLPPASSCADNSHLKALQGITDEQRDLILQTDALLGRAQMARISGRYEEAPPIVREALKLAEQSGHVPSVIELKRTLGVGLCGTGQCDEGVALLDEATFESERLGLDLERMEVLEDQLFIRALFRSEFDRAMWFSQAAESLADRIEASDLDRAPLVARQAALADMMGRHVEALELAERALELRLATGRPVDSNHAMVMNYKGNALYHLARYREALEVYEQSLELSRGMYGPTHPVIANDYENIGNALRALGDLEGALDRERRAVRIFRTIDDGGVRLGHALLNLGGTYSEMGRYAEAVETIEEAVDLNERAAPNSPAHGVSLLNLSEARMYTGELTAALDAGRKSVEILEGTLGPKHPYVGAALATLGHLRVERGEFDEAMKILPRAREILSAEGSDPLARAEADLNWAIALTQTAPQRSAEAEPVAREALRALDRIAPRGAKVRAEGEAWFRSRTTAASP